MYEIYKVTCVNNNKSYIGITSVGIKKRWRQHISCAFNPNSQDFNAIFKKAIRKHGVRNFIINTIDTASNLNEANQKEMYYIQKYNTFAFNENSNGYNSTFGGDGVEGYGTTPVVKIEIQSGKILKHYSSIKEAESCYGSRICNIYNLSKNISTKRNVIFVYQSAIENLSESEIKEKVYKYCNVILQFDLEGNLIKVWTNIETIANQTGYKQGNISSVISGDRRQAHNYIWKTYNDFLNNNDICLRDKKTTATPVLQYDLEGNFIKKFHSVTSAEIETGISNSKIVAVCKHKRNHAGGYVWCYEEDTVNIDAISFIKNKNDNINQRKTNRNEMKSRNINNIVDKSTGEKFLSISEISDLTGISRKVIREVLNGKREEYKGHKWRYLT